MGPVPEIYARVYRSRGMNVPIMSSPYHLGALIPLRLRALHKAYAKHHNFWWRPCILCGRHYGAHEISGAIPDPTRVNCFGEIQCHGICAYCTIERNRTP